MDAKTINKYKNKTIPQLRKIATRHFNKYIRLRDTNENGYGRCISCGHMLKYNTPDCQAGHFFPAGHYPTLAYNEDNVNLQCKSDNYYKSGNLIEYRKNLLKKIGQKRLDKLYFKAENYKKNGFKQNRFYLIEVIETYKEKCKELGRDKNFKI